MAETITFTVLGEAKPAGSKRAFALRKNGVLTGRAAVVDANPNSRDWKNAVASAARDAYQGALLDGPLRLSLCFYRPRPKGHFGAKGMNAKGRGSIAPTMKPDCTKLIRGVEDALTGIIWRDDAQIVAQFASKDWGEPARVEIVIEQFIPRSA